MSISSERIEPTPRVVEPQGAEKQGHPDPGSRRRRTLIRDEPEKEESAEMPAHQVDRLA